MTYYNVHIVIEDWDSVHAPAIDFRAPFIYGQLPRIGESLILDGPPPVNLSVTDIQHWHFSDDGGNHNEISVVCVPEIEDDRAVLIDLVESNGFVEWLGSFYDMTTEWMRDVADS